MPPASADQQTAEARRLRAEGLTWPEIGRRVGLPKTTIQSRVFAAERRERGLAPKVGTAQQLAQQSAPVSERFGATFEASGDTGTIDATSPSIRTLPQLMEAAEVDPAEWHVTHWKSNVWETNAGGGTVLPLWQVKATLERRPEWQRLGVIPREPITRQPVEHTQHTALILPDVQFGYRWRNRELVPLHDPRACALAVEVARRLQPSVIVQVGDLMDFAPLSMRWPTPPELRGTTTEALRAAHGWLRSIRQACPSAHMHVIEGNHEERLTRLLVERAPEFLDLAAANDEAPLLTIPRMLALDALDIEYHAGYPAAEVWLWGDKLRVTHGKVVRQGGGSTVAAILKGAVYSTVVGHIHRREWAARTVHGPAGSREIVAGSPGTLSRIDGAVPGDPKPDWQQGLAALHLVGDSVMVESWPIVDGRLVYRGEVIEAGWREAA